MGKTQRWRGGAWVAACIALAACREPVALLPLERQAQLDREELDLGGTFPGGVLRGVVRMRNTGESTVRASLSLSPPEGPFLVLPRDVVADSTWKAVDVWFLASSVGLYRGTLTFHTNSTTTETLRVRLRARIQPAPDCEDHNPCTLDLFDGTSCIHVEADLPCNDGDACTTGDRCVLGTCVGKAVDCDDGVECTEDRCAPAVGCVHVPRAERCDDGNPCSVDVCSPESGCSHTQSPDGASCGPPTCVELMVCKDWECRTTPTPDGFPCEDGDPCTVGDQCHSGECHAGLGQPLGMADTVVVGAGLRGPGGAVLEPVELGGIQPLGDGVVRVAWRAAPLGNAQCPDGSCDPEQEPCQEAVRGTPGGFVVFVTDVDVLGKVRRHVELAPPEPGAAAVAVRAAPSPDGLVVVALFLARPGCCAAPPCALAPRTATAALYRVSAEGVEGPVVLGTQDVRDLPGAEQLPLAVASQGCAAVAVWGRAGTAGCSGACPLSLELEVQRVDLGTQPPSLGEVSAVATELPAGAEGLRGLADTDLTLWADDVVVVWRTALAPEEAVPACGGADGRRWVGHLWQGRLHDASAGSVQVITAGRGAVHGISVTHDVLGPAVFLDQQTIRSRECGPGTCGADGGSAACDVRDRLSARGTVLYDHRSSGGRAAVVGLGSGTAFGLAAGVALLADGDAQLVSPSLGNGRPILGRYAPSAGDNVRLLARGRPAVEQDGLRAWAAALALVEIPEVPARDVALVEAGCGLRSSGRVRGWPPEWPDGGVADPGTSPADRLRECWPVEETGRSAVPRLP